MLAGYQALERFLHPQPLAHLGWVLAAGLVGFAGNELVALYRIRVGRRIASAALIADGIHARTDGFTSLAVILSVLGVWAGIPIADPIIGLLISIAILILLIGTARDIGRRLLDGVDPALVDQAQQVVESVPGITTVNHLRMRWTGHRLNVEATVTSDPTMPVGEFHELEHQAADLIRGTPAATLPHHPADIDQQAVHLRPSNCLPVPERSSTPPGVKEMQLGTITSSSRPQMFVVLGSPRLVKIGRRRQGTRQGLRAWPQSRGALRQPGTPERLGR